MSAITADDIGLNVKQETLRNYIVKWEMKQKLFVKKTENFIAMLDSLIIHMKKYVLPDQVILLKRSYCKAKSLSQTRTIISFSSTPDGPASPYVAVFYQTNAKIYQVILLKRSYCKAKSLSQTRTIISFSSTPDGPASPYVAVFYQTNAKIYNDSKILCHDNAKEKVSLEKPHLRTNDQILSKARECIDKRMPPKEM